MRFRDSHIHFHVMDQKVIILLLEMNHAIGTSEPILHLICFCLRLISSILDCGMVQGARDLVGTVVAIVTDSVCEAGPIRTNVEHP